eukprot:TRINITY_DN46297_c0_g1_i1.p1 TRINITY_DN46297_c0_g1~~TRINITY_DN46297_c0_g1_i1.p1  ORF type:complete len:330 (-),score=24.38 TRINITY_DN46297_c0_g1_i1:27-992(-)
MSQLSPCDVCGTLVDTANEKRLKQHLRSKPHKVAAKKSQQQDKQSEAVEQPLEHTESDSDDDCPLSNLGAGCPVSVELHDSGTLPQGRPHLLPPFFPKMTAKRLREQTTPFITYDGGWLCGEVPTTVEEACELYLCNDGQKMNLPNIDVNGCRIQVPSWRSARESLLQAHAEGDVFWATSIVDLQHPRWFDKKKEVAAFTQVIIGNAGAGIGIHFDHYKHKKVATYVTIHMGVKHVLLLPPTTEHTEDGTVSPAIPDWVPKEFPVHPSPELLALVKEHKGYYFDLAPLADGEPLTLYMPKGWLHWILCPADWSVVCGGSMF